jgi:UDP-N-acetylglucosamine:LPS N-acetylglucosamine transferase
MREQLWPTIRALFDNEALLRQMSDNARALARPDAAARLADLLTKLACAG